MEAEEKNAEEIFHRAIEIAEVAEQAAYLDQACGKDEELRNKVEALLQAHEHDGSFLESKLVDPNVTLERPASMDGSRTVIGSYRLLAACRRTSFLAVIKSSSRMIDGCLHLSGIAA
jgi:hypothetical protein